MNTFEVVAHILLIKRGLLTPGLVLIARPEARRIGREHLIGKYDAFGMRAELKFRVSKDQTALLGVLGSLFIYGQT